MRANIAGYYVVRPADEKVHAAPLSFKARGLDLASVQGNKRRLLEDIATFTVFVLIEKAMTNESPVVFLHGINDNINSNGYSPVLLVVPDKNGLRADTQQMYAGVPMLETDIHKKIYNFDDIFSYFGFKLCNQ